MIYTKKSGEEVEYITRREADERNIPYVPWREASEEGQYVLSDDDMVLRVTRLKILSPKSRRVNVGLGVRYTQSKMPLHILVNVKNRALGLLPYPWWQLLERYYPKLREEVIQAILTGKISWNTARRYNRDEYAEMIRIAKVSFRGTSRSWYNVRMYINHDEVRMSLAKQIKEMAEIKGFTVEQVFDLLNEAITLARVKGDPKALIQVADRMAGIVGMKKIDSDFNKTLPPAADDELPGSDTAFDKILERKKEVEEADATVEE